MVIAPVHVLSVGTTVSQEGKSAFVLTVIAGDDVFSMR